MQTTTAKTTTKKTPIAPPVQMEAPLAGTEETPRPTRGTKFFLLIHNPETTATFLMEFESKTEIKEYFARNPMCTIQTDFIIRGYKKPLVKMQTVRF